MLIAGFGYLWCMGGSRKFCRGWGCPENSILVFSQRAVRTWPPIQSIWTQGVVLLLEVVNNSISKETYNNNVIFQVGCKPAVPHPRDTHMWCLANNLNSVAQSVAYLLNMQADRRSHPAYFSWKIVSLLMIQEDQVVSYLYKNEQK